MKNPKAKLWVMTLLSFVFIALAIFLSAGTIDYWQAWVYLAVTVVTSVRLALYFAANPVLLENRTKIGPAAEARPIRGRNGRPGHAGRFYPAARQAWPVSCR